MLFMIQWQINHDQKMETWETFAGMTPADDAAAEQAHGIRQIGRWHSVADGRGIAIVEADSAESVLGFCMSWSAVLSTFDVTPVLDDAGTRQIVSAFLSSQ
jgi:hypothetical protein